ncbi:hypothetical protein [Paenibacillus sp. B2(2019)]|uniref:hypothetical protein n=1 Tax=Paenibacillus sp. B2(2019) TaxID=2607754 RepID=UPI000A85781F|nr:hypothetical protein [Paenibacillus sp. B2(2019)]
MSHGKKVWNCRSEAFAFILGFQPQYGVIKSGNLRITAIGSPKLSCNGGWITLSF